VTLALHGAILAAVGVAQSRPQEPIIAPREFVAAELVKLGKPRDKFWLPRITQPPPPEAPKPEIKIAEDPNAPPVVKEPPKIDDPKTSKRTQNALKRIRDMMAEEQPDEGSASGSNIGTASQAVGDQYLATIRGLLMQNFVLPAGIAPDQIPIPPEIKFRIGSDGSISEVKMLKASGNNFVDDACVQAAELTRKVPPPPPGYRAIRVACEK
jgi:TonB family protein